MSIPENHPSTGSYQRVVQDVLSNQSLAIVGVALAAIGTLVAASMISSPMSTTILVSTGGTFAALGILYLAIQGCKTRPQDQPNTYLFQILGLFRNHNIIRKDPFIKKTSDQLKSEFEALPYHDIPDNSPLTLSFSNNLDRYSNILPFQTNRYQMTNPYDQDLCPYINASVLPTGHILTQGPFVHTINDFWLMVWDSIAKQIIMATECVENGKVKCAQYWPSGIGQKMTCGELSISLESDEFLFSHIVRTFKITRGNEERMISHIQLKGWGDHQSFNIDDLKAAIGWGILHSNETQIVHCSAGVGRSGAYICCELISRLLPFVASNCETIDIQALVTFLRSPENGRAGFVQSSDQYEMIHQFYENLITSRNQILAS